MRQEKVLIVEDDTDINLLIKRVLERNNFEVVQAFSGTEAELRLTLEHYNIVLLDLMLPGLSGEALLPMISEKNIPVIVLSAKAGVHDRIHLLNMGADDYITKPFESEELVARIHAVLRRWNKESPELAATKVEYTYKNLTLSTESREVFIGGNQISLTAHEFDILYLLVKSPQKVYSRESLYEIVWKNGYYGEDNTVNVHISNIRKKIAEVTGGEGYIKTVWGIGFKLD